MGGFGVAMRWVSGLEECIRTGVVVTYLGWVHNEIGGSESGQM